MEDKDLKNNISQKIKSETRKYEFLKKAFLKLYEAENKDKDDRNSSFDKLITIKEDNQRLQKIYISFISEMKKVEGKREEHLMKIKDLFLPVIDYYPKRLKETKECLENFEKSIKRKEKLEKSRDELKNVPEEIGQYNNNLKTSKIEVAQGHQNLEKKICDFEEERVEDNKCLFLRFIYSELKYHANALEIMNKLFSEINENEVRLDLEKFAKSYNLDLKKYNIDLQKFKADEQKKNEEQKEIQDEVYNEENENNSDEEKED